MLLHFREWIEELDFGRCGLLKVWKKGSSCSRSGQIISPLRVQQRREISIIVASVFTRAHYIWCPLSFTWLDYLSSLLHCNVLNICFGRYNCGVGATKISYNVPRVYFLLSDHIIIFRPKGFLLVTAKLPLVISLAIQLPRVLKTMMRNVSGAPTWVQCMTDLIHCPC